MIEGSDGDQPTATSLDGVDEAHTQVAVRTALLDCERRRGSRIVWALAVATPTASVLGGLSATRPSRGRRAAKPGYRC